MRRAFESRLGDYIVHDRFFLVTLTSYLATAVLGVNITVLKSPPLGLVATAIYFLINSFFLGTAFFSKKSAIFRLTLGLLLLNMLLGFVGWVIVVFYTLDTMTTVLALVFTTSASTLLKRTVGIGSD